MNEKQREEILAKVGEVEQKLGELEMLPRLSVHRGLIHSIRCLLLDYRESINLDRETKRDQAYDRREAKKVGKTRKEYLNSSAWRW